MFARRGKNLLTVITLVALAVVVVLSLVLLTASKDTALLVVSHQWERTIEVEEFTGKRWVVTRTETNSGTSVGDDLTWPRVKLRRTGNCDGCQRQGRRLATYQVSLLDRVSQRHLDCEFDEARWKSFTIDSRWQGEFDPRTGVLDCHSLVPTD
jgi:hypothetical protein